MLLSMLILGVIAASISRRRVHERSKSPRSIWPASELPLVLRRGALLFYLPSDLLQKRDLHDPVSLHSPRSVGPELSGHLLEGTIHRQFTPLRARKFLPFLAVLSKLSMHVVGDEIRSLHQFRVF